MNGLTASQAEKLLGRKEKRQNCLLVYRLMHQSFGDAEEIISPEGSVASLEEDNIEASGSLHVCCRKGDIALI